MSVEDTVRKWKKKVLGNRERKKSKPYISENVKKLAMEKEEGEKGKSYNKI